MTFSMRPVVADNVNMRRTMHALTVAVAALVVAATVATSGHAMSMGTPKPDSDAPTGAAWTWLPDERWVMDRWLPFDEKVLLAKLRVSSEAMIGWTNVHKPLKTLAARRHVRWRGLAADLVARSWKKPLSPERRALLVSRTVRVLTQPHLSQHVLRHEFHTWAIWRHTINIFGVPRDTFEHEDFNLTMIQVAATAGVSAEELRRRVLAANEAAGSEGVASKQMTKSENTTLRTRDRSTVDAWLNLSTARQRMPPMH